MSQKNVFASTEGDEWFRRNAPSMEKGSQLLRDLCEKDPMLNRIFALGLTNERVLEVGAANGWRLAAIKKRFPKVECYGVEPSAEAVADAHDGVTMIQGTADRLPFDDGFVDLVLYGACLLWCDPADHFRIALEGDRVLADKGHIVVRDLYARQPYKKPYRHDSRVMTYKMDYQRLFLASPHYFMVDFHLQNYQGKNDFDPDKHYGISVLRKDTSAAWMVPA